MDGVEILNSYKIIEYTFGINGLGVFFGILCLISAFAFIYSIDKGILIGFFLAPIFFIIFLTLFSDSLTKDSKIETKRYEVTISDEVNYNKFIEKYNVIEERGRILVVGEK